jgi:hypothetical protein
LELQFRGANHKPSICDPVFFSLQSAIYNDVMQVAAWLAHAIADAEARGLPGLKPLLETLARSTQTLRDADGEFRHPAAEHALAAQTLRSAPADAAPRSTPDDRPRKTRKTRNTPHDGSDTD